MLNIPLTDLLAKMPVEAMEQTLKEFLVPVVTTYHFAGNALNYRWD